MNKNVMCMVVFGGVFFGTLYGVGGEAAASDAQEQLPLAGAVLKAGEAVEAHDDAAASEDRECCPVEQCTILVGEQKEPCPIKGDHGHMRFKCGLVSIDVPGQKYSFWRPNEDGSLGQEEFWAVTAEGQDITLKTVIGSHNHIREILLNELREHHDETTKLQQDVDDEKARHRIRAKLDQGVYLELFKEKRELEQQFKEEKKCALDVLRSERLQRGVIAALKNNARRRTQERERTKREELEILVAFLAQERNALQQRCGQYESDAQAKTKVEDTHGDDDWLTIIES